MRLMYYESTGIIMAYLGSRGNGISGRGNTALIGEMSGDLQKSFYYFLFKI